MKTYLPEPNFSTHDSVRKYFLKRGFSRVFCSDFNVVHNVTFVKTIMAFSQVGRAVHTIILAKGKADIITRVNICDLRDIYTVSETFLPKDH